MEKTVKNTTKLKTLLVCKSQQDNKENKCTTYRKTSSTKSSASFIEASERKMTSKKNYLSIQEMLF